METNSHVWSSSAVSGSLVGLLRCWPLVDELVVRWWSGGGFCLMSLIGCTNAARTAFARCILLGTYSRIIYCSIDKVRVN